MPISVTDFVDLASESAQNDSVEETNPVLEQRSTLVSIHNEDSDNDSDSDSDDNDNDDVEDTQTVDNDDQNNDDTKVNETVNVEPVADTNAPANQTVNDKSVSDIITEPNQTLNEYITEPNQTLNDYITGMISTLDSNHTMVGPFPTASTLTDPDVLKMWMDWLVDGIIATYDNGKDDPYDMCMKLRYENVKSFLNTPTGVDLKRNISVDVKFLLSLFFFSQKKVLEAQGFTKDQIQSFVKASSSVFNLDVESMIADICNLTADKVHQLEMDGCREAIASLEKSGKIEIKDNIIQLDNGRLLFDRIFGMQLDEEIKAQTSALMSLSTFNELTASGQQSGMCVISGQKLLGLARLETLQRVRDYLSKNDSFASLNKETQDDTLAFFDDLVADNVKMLDEQGRTHLISDFIAQASKKTGRDMLAAIEQVWNMTPEQKFLDTVRRNVVSMRQLCVSEKDVENYKKTLSQEHNRDLVTGALLKTTTESTAVASTTTSETTTQSTSAPEESTGYKGATGDSPLVTYLKQLQAATKAADKSAALGQVVASINPALLTRGQVVTIRKVVSLVLQAILTGNADNRELHHLITILISKYQTQATKPITAATTAKNVSINLVVTMKNTPKPNPVTSGVKRRRIETHVAPQPQPQYVPQPHYVQQPQYVSQPYYAQQPQYVPQQQQIVGYMPIYAYLPQL